MEGNSDELGKMLDSITLRGDTRPKVQEVESVEFHPIDVDSTREEKDLEKPRDINSNIYEQAWYKMLKEKCEKEPNRTHVIYLDQGSMDDETFKKRIDYLEGLYKEGILPPNATIGYSGKKEVVLDSDKPQEDLRDQMLGFHEFTHMVSSLESSENKPEDSLSEEDMKRLLDSLYGNNPKHHK